MSEEYTKLLGEQLDKLEEENEELRKENEALKAALVKCRDNVLEQAAKECERVMMVPTWSDNMRQAMREYACDECAEAIRAMKEQP